MSTIICYTLILFLLLPIGECFNYSYHPQSFDFFRKYEERILLVSIEKNPDDPPGDMEMEVAAECNDQFYCEIVEAPEKILLNSQNHFNQTFQVKIRANFLGYAQVNIAVDEKVLQPYKLRLLRSAWEQKVSHVYTMVISVFILLITFFMGTQLEWSRIYAILKTPIGPITGFVCQFLLMPLVGFTVARYGLNEDDVMMKLALFAASTCPGGGKSSFWTIIYGGNLDLSVAMTFTQTVSALVMMPLWMSTLGRYFTTKRVTIPFGAIMEGLLVLMIPSGSGMLFIHYKPHLVKKFERWIKIATWCATIIFTATALYANYYIFYLFTWRIVLCGICLPWSGYIVAYCTAYLFRQEWKERITIAIETGVQNVGIAAILMMWCLPEPEVDISLVILLVIILSTDKPLILIYLILKAKQRWQKKDAEDDESEESKINGGTIIIARKTSALGYAHKVEPLSLKRKGIE